MSETDASVETGTRTWGSTTTSADQGGAHGVGVAVFAGLPVVAQGLGALLAGDDVRIVGVTSDVADLPELIVGGGAVVVVTGMLGKPDEDPRRVFEIVRDAAARAEVSVATVCVIPSTASITTELKRQGATTVLTLGDDPALLRHAVAVAGSRRPVRIDPVDADRTSIGAEEFGHDITAREMDVLQGLVDGLSSRDIAAKLEMSVNTVRTHVQRLLPKLGAHNRLRAAAVALDAGLVSPTVRRL